MAALASAVRQEPIPQFVGRTAAGTLIAIGGALILIPLLLTLYLSVFDEKLIVYPPRGYTLSWYPRIIPEFAGPLLTSLELAVAATMGSLLLGVPAGIGLARHRFRGREAISMLLLAPLTVPGVALGLAIYCFAVLLEENTGIGFSSSIWPMVGAHLLITTPWVIRLCLAALTNYERDTEEAAASLGARPLTVIWRVTLPAMRQGIIAGGLFAFIFSFGNLEATLFLVSPGITTLPIALLNYLEYHIDPLVAAVAVAQIMLVGGGLLLLDRYVKLGTIVE